jgi:hypothetical protein
MRTYPMDSPASTVGGTRTSMGAPSPRDAPNVRSSSAERATSKAITRVAPASTTVDEDRKRTSLAFATVATASSAKSPAHAAPAWPPLLLCLPYLPYLPYLLYLLYLLYLRIIVTSDRSRACRLGSHLELVPT